jgi:hypothetical protein
VTARSSGFFGSGTWNDDQPKLYARLLAGEPVAPVSGVDASVSTASLSTLEATQRYLPSPFARRSSRSCRHASSMASGGRARRGHSDGPRLRRGAHSRPLTGYVEVMRGTPILLQLFVLLLRNRSGIKLPAFGAAFLGLALNYPAHESRSTARRSKQFRRDNSRRRRRSASARGRFSCSSAVRRPSASRLRR